MRRRPRKAETDCPRPFYGCAGYALRRLRHGGCYAHPRKTGATRLRALSLAPMTTGQTLASDQRRFQRSALSRPKTASGASRPLPHRRLSRWRLQPTDASGKNAASYDPVRRGPHLPQSDERKLSPCMVNFLSRATSGTDWGAVRAAEGSTWGGTRASTSLNLVTFRDWRYAGNSNLVFHELGHLPDWQSGELTNLSYLGDSASAMWDGQDSWAGNRFGGVSP